MWRMVVVVVMLSLAAGAWANVKIHLTTSATGLVDPAYWGVPTNGNHTDITDGNWRVNSFPTAPSNPTVSPGEVVFVWFTFQGEPNNRKVNGLDLDMTGATAACWYVLDDRAGAYADARWDGGIAPPLWHRTHIALTAAVYGLRNALASDAGWLYEGGTSRTYLLGAVQYDYPGVHTPQLGVAGISYSGGYEPPTVEFGSVTVTPEPGGVILAVVAALWIRKR